MKRRLFILPLESRLTPSSTAVRFDNGDFYRAGGRSIPLVERVDQVAVRLDAPLTDARFAAGGDLAGYELVMELRGGGAILRQSASPKQHPSEAVPAAERAGVVWSSPVFETTDTHGYVIPTDEVVVRLRPGIREADFLAGSPFESLRPLMGTPDQFYARVLSGPRSTLSIAEQYSHDPRLLWATPAFLIQSHLLTNDTLYPNQWHLNNTGQSGGVPGSDVNAPEAWAVTTGSPNIVIADIDDAIQRGHPDLAGNVWANPGEVNGNGIDDDANGYIDDVLGWDFWDSDSDPSPNVGSGDNHGTATAGVAVAVGDNNLGVAGIAYGARLMPIRSNIVPALSPPDVPTAIYYAAGRTADGLGTWRGADIITNSWAFDAPYQPLDDAFAWASANGRGGKGIAMFVASGNGGNGQVAYPANLAGTLSGVIAVGGSTHNDVRAGYSQYGPELDFITPTRSSGGGGGIYTTDRTGSDGYSSSDYTGGFSGTSSATPLAAGIGALALSQNPNLTALQLRSLLHSATDLISSQSYDVNTGKNLEYGFGRLNAEAAVKGVNTRVAQVLEGNGPLASGAATSTFTATTASPQTKTYRLRNRGTQDLTLGAISVTDPAYVIASSFADTTLAVGESTTFSVQFAPTTGGTIDATLSFPTNDPLIPTYSFALSGTATDVTPPTVETWVIGDGTVQRSRITSLRVDFSEVVSPAVATPFQLSGPGGNVPLSFSFSTANDKSQATIQFTGGTEYGSLPDGSYTLTVVNNGVEDAAGNPLSPLASTNFHRKFGDADGDTHVDLTDLIAFRTALDDGGPSFFDFNNDTFTDLNDFIAFRERMGT